MKIIQNKAYSEKDRETNTHIQRESCLRLTRNKNESKIKSTSNEKACSQKEEKEEANKQKINKVKDIKKCAKR